MDGSGKQNDSKDPSSLYPWLTLQYFSWFQFLTQLGLSSVVEISLRKNRDKKTKNRNIRALTK